MVLVILMCLGGLGKPYTTQIIVYCVLGEVARGD